MEDQVKMEEAGKLQGLPAVGENRNKARRITLLLVCMTAQWLVLLACVIAIYLCCLKSPDAQPQWVSVKFNPSSVSTKHVVDIKMKEGTMKILNNRSIQISCDGHYFFSLKGTIRQQRSNDSLMLSVKKRQDEQKESLLDVSCSDRKTVVQQTTMFELRAQDEISLEANQSATDHDLSLVLFMFTPHSFCSPEKS